MSIKAYSSSTAQLLRNFSVPLLPQEKALQALCSYKLRFSFKTEAGVLNYLGGKEFAISKRDIYFTKEFFER